MSLLKVSEANHLYEKWMSVLVSTNGEETQGPKSPKDFNDAKSSVML